ncbi:MAG: twin-arginine translocase TatA/TatE family subunit [Verrucomicrobiales bacterium]
MISASLPTTILAIPTLGGPELLLIGAVVLLLFGAKKLPQLARGIGRSLGEFKQARKDFDDEISAVKEVADVKKSLKL